MTVTLIIIIVALAWYIYSQKNSSTKQVKSPPPAPDNPNEIVFRITVETSSPDPHAPPIAEQVDKDAWDVEEYAPGMKQRKLGGVNLNIKFVDLEGSATQRNITTIRYVHNPTNHAGSVYAFCHLRQANRPFAFKRIHQATDLETGEIIPDIGAFLDNIYRATPLYKVENFLQDHDAGSFVLFSFAKADGAMRAKERAIILDWAKAQGLTDQPALTVLEEQMRDWYMTTHSFWDAVKKINKQERPPEYVQALWQAVQAIVASDKKQAGQEELFLRYAAKQWDIPRKDIAIADISKK
jgi:uncharacterized tellurite resistance protein B-like protein